MVGPHDAGDDLAERRLACAVLADKAVDLSLGEGEVHAGERLGAAEALGQAVGLDQHGVAHPAHSGCQLPTVAFVT